MTFKMEDDNYRTSSQYRLWSFTPENLSEIRTTTNQAAETQVRAAFQRAREKKRRLQKENLSSSSEGDTPGVDKEKETSTSEEEEEKAIECLTPEEELKLVRYYCRMIMEIAQHVFEFPTNVKVRLWPSGWPVVEDEG